MSRTLPADFATEAGNKAGAAPYFILEIQWTTGTKYYLDRPTGTFAASGTRHPATIQTPLVVDWGETSLELREGLIGGNESRTVKIEDTGRAVSSILKTANQQRVQLKIWRMFDTASVTWSTDALLVFHGSIVPYSWELGDNVVTLQCEDAGNRLLKHVSHTAKNTIFTEIKDEYRDRHIPIVWGRAHRVEAILVSQPWETSITEPIPSGLGDYTVDVADHPDDIGISSLGSAGSPIEVWMGTELVEGYFTQSGDKDNVPSTFTITSPSRSEMLSFIFAAIDGTGTSRRGITWKNYMYVPRGKIMPDDFATAVVGKECTVYVRGFVGSYYMNEYVETTISAVSQDDPWPTGYKITFADSNVNESLGGYEGTRVWEAPASTRGQYPSGTKIRPKDEQWVYVANDLPSKQVRLVEGYGDNTDAAGDGRFDFIPIGVFVSDELDGSTILEGVINEAFTINLNDSTWSGTLGHNVTTITINRSPRHLNLRLQSNRIWVTLDGIEDGGDSLGSCIYNPALVILEYLENTHLCGVAAGDIDSSAFTTAAGDSVISTRRCGFAQIEPMNGLEIIQEIARQCHCAVFFDLGKVTIQVLQNSSPGTALTFNTTTSDNIRHESLTERDSDIDELVSHVVGRWRKEWDDIVGNKLNDVVRIQSGVESAFGRRDAEFPIWIYYKRSDVEAELDFYVTRWSRIYRHLTWEGFHDALKLQPADWASFSYVDGNGTALYASQALEILRTVDTGIEGVVALEGRFAAYTY